MDQTRSFLERVLPWPQRAPGGWRQIWVARRLDGRPKPIFQGYAFTELDAATRVAKWAAAKDMDVYVCMSVQAKCDEAKAAKYPDAKLTPASKSQAEALWLQAFWLDVDVKPKGYPDLLTAGNEISKFTTKVGLPAPQIIVKSGGGLHVYWLPDTVLTLAQWLPIAENLKSAALAHHLPMDTGLIADAARLLRVPGTWNLKIQPRREVKLLRNVMVLHPLAAISGPLAAFHGAASPTPSPTTTSGSSGQLFEQAGPIAAPLVGIKISDAEFSTGGEHKAQPVDMKLVAENCAVVGAALADHGAGFGNEVWHQLVYMASYTDDGRAWAHRLSSGHATYQPADTDREYDRVLRERATRDRGWTSCKVLMGLAEAAPHCGTCTRRAEPAMGDRPSPMKLGRSDADLPRGYRRVGCTIERMVEDKDSGDTEWRPLIRAGVRDAWIERAPTGRVFHAQMVLPRDTPEEIILPIAEINGRGLAASLGKFGLSVAYSAELPVRQFFNSFVDQLNATVGAPTRAAPFGWHAPGGEVAGFAYSGRLYTVGPVQDTMQLSPALRTEFHPQGKLAKWKEAAEFIVSQKQQDRCAIVASAFAGPLMRFTGDISGLTLSAWSAESGIGKSASIKLAQSVWGHPVSAMQTLDDTPASVINKLGALRSLPLFWDEIKSQEQIERFITLAFQVGQGKEKSRLTSAIEQRATASWQALVMACSNESLVDKVSAKLKTTDAGAYRLLEWEVRPAPINVPGPAALRTMQQLQGNYGVAGEVYAEWLGRNHFAAQKIVQTAHDQLAFELGDSKEERFWLAGAAALYAGAFLAAKLALVPFDLPVLRAFLVATVRGNRKLRVSNSTDMSDARVARERLAEFLASRPEQILRTDVFGAIGVAIKVLSDWTRMRGCTVQAAQDVRRMRISYAALGDWAAQQKLSRQNVVDALVAHFNGKHVLAVLGGGTPVGSGVRQRVLEIDLALVDAAQAPPPRTLRPTTPPLASDFAPEKSDCGGESDFAPEKSDCDAVQSDGLGAPVPPAVAAAMRANGITLAG